MIFCCCCQTCLPPIQYITAGVLCRSSSLDSSSGKIVLRTTSIISLGNYTITNEYFNDFQSARNAFLATRDFVLASASPSDSDIYKIDSIGEAVFVDGSNQNSFQSIKTITYHGV